MKKILISALTVLSVNVLAQEPINTSLDSMSKNFIENRKNTQTKVVRIDSNGKNLLTLEQVYKKYGTGEDAQKYIERNEMYDSVEKRNQEMK